LESGDPLVIRYPLTPQVDRTTPYHQQGKQQHRHRLVQVTLLVQVTPQ
jgi:hypothetical protein